MPNKVDDRFGALRKVDRSSEGFRSAAPTITLKTYTLPAEKAQDKQAHSEQYEEVVISSRGQALAFFGGDDALLWSAVSDWVTGRNLRNAKTLAFSKSRVKTDEQKLAPSIVAMISSGLPNAKAVAVQTAAASLGFDATAAEAYVDKVIGTYENRKKAYADKKAAKTA